MEAGAMEGEETKKGKRKGRDTGFDDIDDKFDQLLAISAEVKRAEGMATEKIQLWRSASGFDEMSAALKEWQFWTQEKERLLATKLRPLAKEIVEFYKREIEEDAGRVLDEEEQGDSSEGGKSLKGEVDDLAMSLADVLSLVERAKLKDRHCSPAKRRRNMPMDEQESECLSAEDIAARDP